MGMFDRLVPKKKQPPKPQQEFRQYISGAGACIVSKSVLERRTALRWLFREDNGIGNGWVAFGASDTQEYLDQAENLVFGNFNTLANVEPAVLNVLYLPVGADLEFKSDQSGKYFVDTRTGKEIREPVKHPGQAAFEKNLKFLNQTSYPAEFFRGLFEKDDLLEPFVIGEADFPSGEIVLADPLVYLGDRKYSTFLNRTIPAGAYPVELSICRSPIVGLRVAAAKLKISSRPVKGYELAMPRGYTVEQLNQPGVFSFFGVDAGMACFCDAAVADEYARFLEKWSGENPGKNRYDDYFAQEFRRSYEAHPQVQREGGDFVVWKLPESGHRIAMFTSGMGDGIYSGYWALDAEGEPVELIVPFMNPPYFRG